MMDAHRPHTRTLMLDDVGSLSAPPGSQPWARAVQLELRGLLHEATSDLRAIRRYIQGMLTYKGYQQLDDEFGHPFASMRAFAQASEPWGLGYDADILDEIVTETRQMTLAEFSKKEERLSSTEERWTVVAAVARAISHGGGFLEQVPALLKRIIREDMWRTYRTPVGTIETYDTFAAFVGDRWGLHTSLATLFRLCQDDLEALDFLDRVTTEKPGAKQGNQHAAKTTALSEDPQGVLVANEIENKTNGMIHSICLSDKERGPRRNENLRRLRKDFPHLHAEVLSGKKSITEAAVEAGIYPPRIAINLRCPNSAAKTIMTHCDKAFIAALILALGEGSHD